MGIEIEKCTNQVGVGHFVDVRRKTSYQVSEAFGVAFALKVGQHHVWRRVLQNGAGLDEDKRLIDVFNSKQVWVTAQRKLQY